MVSQIAGGDLSAELQGLTRVEVAQRMEAGAINAVPTGPSRTVADIVKANLLTVFNVLLGVLFVAIVIVAPIQDALFGAVLVINAAIGIIQELRAKKTLDDLALLSAPQARVIREGHRLEIAVDQVVQDDLLELAPGDQVIVDGPVIHTSRLEVDESLLTGESDAIMKGPGDEVLSGSFVVSGSGVYQAKRIGVDAYAHKLADEAKQFTLVRSELRQGIDLILKAIAWVLVPTAGLLAWSQFQANDNLKEAIRTSIAGMVAMIPQGLVLLTSVAFAVGVIRLGRRKVLVQELPSVEGLARVDVVCFDKTGTLTEGKLVVESMTQLSTDHDPAAALGAIAASDPNPNATQQAIGEAFAQPPGWWPTSTVPFSSARKWSAATFGSQGSWILGAPEMILPNTPAVDDRIAEMAASGSRVLLLAHAPGEIEGEQLPFGLEPVALLALGDRIRADAADTLRYFTRQGVAAKVISGDHPATVGAIARQVGVPGAENVVDARDLPEDQDQLADVLEQGTVFGRVTPHQKRAMVGALQSRGHVVAMTGDGVNDVLALKDADIGIAMGSGSSASRSVAQLVLLEGKFDTLPSVVGEGRRVISNMERVANLFVTKTVYAFLLVILVGAFARPFPFVPRHLTLVGTLTIGAPSFFLALAPSVHRARPGFIKRVFAFAAPVGALAAAATYSAYELGIDELDFGIQETALIQSRTLATLVLVSIGLFALMINSLPLTTPRKWLIGTMAGIFLLILISPAGREFFELDIPRLVVLLAAVGIVGITGAVLYASWRSLGWIKQMPELFATPQARRSMWESVRGSVTQLRERAVKMGEPLDPADLPEEPTQEIQMRRRARRRNTGSS